MAPQLDFTDLVVLVTGAGAGIGKNYARFFASRGAKVVVNDVAEKAAQSTVDEITKAGGKAVAVAGSVAEGQKVVDGAVKAFGTVHVLVNNAGILRDKTLAKMTDQDFDLVVLVHLKGSFSCAKACWPLFRQQKFGRVINIASPAGIYGNVGQANYTAAKMGLVGFTRTLAREGVKYNITANCLVPLAASAMLETALPPEILKGLKPAFIPPLVGLLTAKNGPAVNGRVFELAGGFYSELRLEKSKGVAFGTDATFTPSAVAARWQQVQDFSSPSYPVDSGDGLQEQLRAAKQAGKNDQGTTPVDFKGRTIIITGAGAGLGRAYALELAKLGANIVINDVSAENAAKVVEEVKALGAKAVPAVCSAEEGDKIAWTAVDAFGQVDALIANAGILRDKSFVNMTEQMWDQVIAVHLRGTYKCVKAVWPMMQKQKYGRIITTASPNGLYGTIGQANYSTAKSAMIGFTKTLAIEGKKAGIKINCVAPRAGTAMTATVWPEDLMDAMKPEHVAPVMAYLASERSQDSGMVYETYGGYTAQVRWQRSGGAVFPNDVEVTPEMLLSKWDEVTRFDDRATYPTSTMEAMQAIMANFENLAGSSGSSTSGASPVSDSENYVDPEDTEAIKQIKQQQSKPDEFSYTERDVILYNLGIGAKADELQWVYENGDGFAPLPTFGVIPLFASSSALSLDFLPNFNPARLLHGEQFLSINNPTAIPSSGTIVNHVKLREVTDKGKAAAVVVRTEGKDKHSGETRWVGESTVFIRGSGGFGGKTKSADRGAATALNNPPQRPADTTVEEQTTPEQAALYRLSGDYNPLHLDPAFASMGGFDKPILHGLCFMGIAGKHVYKTYGPYKDIKVRFAGTVLPGQTIVTEMWKEGNKVIFSAKVKETGKPCLSNAAVTLVSASDGQVKAKL